MKRWSTLFAVTGASIVFAPALAKADATAYVVHGIPGEDLGLPAELPVDVSVNGMCALPGFEFGDIVGPLALPAGMYDLAISLADPMMPCGNEPVIEAFGVTLEDGISYSIVAHLTVDGMPTAGVFENGVTPSRGAVTVNLFHTAAAPEVDVTLERGRGRRGVSTVVENLANGTSASSDARPAMYQVSIAPAGGGDPVLGPASFFIAPWAEAYLIYAVGSLDNETFTLLVETTGTKFRADRGNDDDDGRDED